jgi:hypothetical protein
VSADAEATSLQSDEKVTALHYKIDMPEKIHISQIDNFKIRVLFSCQ